MFTGSYTLIYYITLAHLILFFIDHVFRACAFLPYINCFKILNFHIGLFHIRWFTTVFNRYIQKLSSHRTRFQTFWFTFGAWISVLILPFAVLLLLLSLYSLLVGASSKKHSIVTLPVVLEPAIPGINLPTSDTGYYVSTLLICATFHELGHALAAVREGAHVSGVGFLLVFIMPLCFVKVDGMEKLSALKRLKVVSAGVWHNTVLALFSGCVFLSIPWMLYPFYTVGNGVQVKAILEGTTLHGAGGLGINDVVTDINGCKVRNYNSWVECIKKANNEPVFGYCLPSEFVHDHDESVPVRALSSGSVECCRNGTTTNLCFEYMEEHNGPVVLPQYSCLRARFVVHSAETYCQTSSDCDKTTYCLKPSLENSTKLVSLERDEKDVVLFLGHPTEIAKSVRVTEFVENTALPSSIPERMRKFCMFVSMFSAAFAVLNVIPCFYLDGQYIIRALVHICLVGRVRRRSIRLAIALSITIVGSLLLVLYTVLVIASMFSK